MVVCLLLFANIGPYLLQRKADRRDGIAASPAVLPGEVALPTTKLAGDESIKKLGRPAALG